MSFISDTGSDDAAHEIGTQALKLSFLPASREADTRGDPSLSLWYCITTCFPISFWIIDCSCKLLDWTIYFVIIFWTLLKLLNSIILFFTTEYFTLHNIMPFHKNSKNIVCLELQTSYIQICVVFIFLTNCFEETFQDNVKWRWYTWIFLVTI